MLEEECGNALDPEREPIMASASTVLSCGHHCDFKAVDE